MKTDYMVIGRVRNSENILKLISGIENKGFTCFNFLNKPVVPEKADASWEEQMDIFESVSVDEFWQDKNYQFHFKTDMDALKNADALILLLPAGLAAHMEAGASYGFGKKLIIIGELSKPETLYLMANEHHKTIDNFLETI